LWILPTHLRLDHNASNPDEYIKRLTQTTADAESYKFTGEKKHAPQNTQTSMRSDFCSENRCKQMNGIERQT